MSRNSFILSIFVAFFRAVILFIFSFLLPWRPLSGRTEVLIIPFCFYFVVVPSSAFCFFCFIIPCPFLEASSSPWRLNAVLQLTFVSATLLFAFLFSLSSTVLLLLFWFGAHYLWYHLSSIFSFVSHVYVFQMIALSRSLRFIFAFSFSLPRESAVIGCCFSWVGTWPILVCTGIWWGWLVPKGRCRGSYFFYFLKDGNSEFLGFNWCFGGWR